MRTALMNGVSETLFEPNGTVTRGMIVTILHRLEGEPESDYDMPFTDVAEQQWYTEAVRWAARRGHRHRRERHGIRAGRPPSPASSSRPYSGATPRARAMTSAPSADLTGFLDYGQISEYALPALQWAVGRGRDVRPRRRHPRPPQGTATRAEAARC